MRHKKGSGNRPKLIPCLQIGTIWEPQPLRLLIEISILGYRSWKWITLLLISAFFSCLPQGREIWSQLSLGAYLMPCSILGTTHRALTGQTQSLPLQRTTDSLLGLLSLHHSETQSKGVHPKLSPFHLPVPSRYTSHPVPGWSENLRNTALERTMY